MTTRAGTTTYAYDDADRLTEVDAPAASPVAYTWDDNGNLTDRGADEFAWDFEDRMTSATVNSVTSTFTYRGDGLRNSRTVGGGGTVTFTWDIASGLPVILDDGSQQYVYGAGLTSMKQGGNWFYYLADGLGSTMAVVNSSGMSQKSYEYDVYGEVTGGSGSLSQEFDFAGQQSDATGLQYLRARYYDPETGTFLSRDPLASRPDWLESPGGYAGDDPASSSDPSGLSGNPIDKLREAFGAGVLNDKEWSWCVDKSANFNPFHLFERATQCYSVYKLGEYINTDLMPRLFGDASGDDMGVPNAFRHCCWMGITALWYGAGASRGFGLRHEQGDDNGTGDDLSRIDLFNNEVGISIGDSLRKKKGKRSDKQIEIANQCMAAAKNGTLALSAQDPRLR